MVQDKVEPRLLMPKAAAELLSISTRHLLDLCDDRSIAYVDVGRRTRPSRRFLMTDIEDFIAQRRRPVAEKPTFSIDVTKGERASTFKYEILDLQAIRKSLLKGQKAKNADKPKTIGRRKPSEAVPVPNPWAKTKRKPTRDK